MNNNKKHLKYFCLLAFVLLFTYCSNPGSNILIVTNKTNDNLYIDFTKTKSPIDTIVKIFKDNSFRYQIFSFENYSENTNNTDVENELSKIIIFKVINKDTLYLPLEKYNKIEKFDIVIDDDFGYYRNDFNLNITEVMFE
ncbi:MAG: hypothetical protein Q7U47_11850 [Paludibacter sp.]|nr:hypothetical protein [Paludibacter sp.]